MLATPLPMDTKDNTKVVFERAVFTVSAVIFAVILMFCYGYVSLILDPIVYHDPHFWTPISIINSISNLGISSLIAYNARVNYRFRNIFKKVTIKSVEVLYLMCLPALIVVIVTGILTTIRYFVTISCYDPASIVSSFTVNIFYIAVLILLIETNGLVDYGDSWVVNFTNFTAILFTIVYLCGNAILNVSVEQAYIFDRNINVKYVTCNISSRIVNTAKYLQSFQWKATVLFGIVCSIFLINPLTRHYRHLMNFQITDPPQASRGRSPEMSLVQTLLSLCCPTLVFFSTISVLSKHEDIILQYTYQVLTIITYSTLIVTIVLTLRCVKSWQQLVGKQRTFNDILVWISFSGSCCHCFAMLVVCIYPITKDDKAILYPILLLKYVLFSVQITVQNLLEKVLISKEWKHQSWEKHPWLLPFLFFIGISNGVFAFGNFSLPIPIPPTKVEASFFILLFIHGFEGLGETFSTLQRLHGLVFFLYIFFLIKKNMRTQ